MAALLRLKRSHNTRTIGNDSAGEMRFSRTRCIFTGAS